jgi:ribosome modulation factor
VFKQETIVKLSLIYLEGFHAHSRGECPFRVGRERGAWFAGWYAGHGRAA